MKTTTVCSFCLTICNSVRSYPEILSSSSTSLSQEFYPNHSLQIFGDGSIAQAVLSGAADHGHELTINIGWAVGVMMGAYMAIGVTGAHMNPAVTLAMAIRGKTSWFKVKENTQ